MSSPLLSIMICTQNRADKLARCLASLETVLPPQESWDVLVVDNGSRDHTKQAVEAVARRGKIPLRYCFEPQAGLSFARNRGLAQTASPLVAFTDDDCLVDRAWPRTILREFDSDASLDVLGGRVDLEDVHDLPFCTRPFPDRCAISSLTQIMDRLIGCNMAFRRSVFETVGLFDPRLGIGTRAGSSEDTDLLYRALRTGLKLCYSPDLIILHAHGRRATHPLSNVHRNYAKGRGAMYCKHALRGDWAMAKSFGGELLTLLKNAWMNGPTEPTAYPPQKVFCSLFAGVISRLNKTA